MHGPICGQISSLNCTCIQLRTLHRLERHFITRVLTTAPTGAQLSLIDWNLRPKGSTKSKFLRSNGRKDTSAGRPFGGATETIMELIQTTPKNAKFSRLIKSVAPSTSETGLFEHAQSYVLPIRCTVETYFENGVLLDWFCNVRRPTEVSNLCVLNRHLSVLAFLNATTIPARHRVYVFCSREDVETLRRIGWCRAEFDTVWNIISSLASSFVVKKAIAYASREVGMSFIG